MRDPNKFRQVALPLFFIAILAALLLLSYVDSEVIPIIVMLLAVAFVVSFLLFWRCPKCHKMLPNGTLKHCPFCGCKFGDDDENE